MPKTFPFIPLFGRGCVSCLEYYTIMYMMLVVCQMMVDAALFQVIIGTPSKRETDIDTYQSIIIPVHCLQATVQFFFGFDLYKAVISRSYRRARNWRTVYLCLLAFEFSVFVAYIALASFFSILTYVTALVLVFKAYLIWPLKLFLEECHEVCVPLATNQLGGGGHAFVVRSEPGPSTSVTASAASAARTLI